MLWVPSRSLHHQTKQIFLNIKEQGGEGLFALESQEVLRVTLLQKLLLAMLGLCHMGYQGLNSGQLGSVRCKANAHAITVAPKKKI